MDENQLVHILMVDDDEDTRFVYSVLLQMEGYRVTHVGTMSDALARALSTHYDLIVMDVRLPDGDGVELCTRIRTFNRVTPIIFVSAAAYEKDIDRGMKAGAQAYITKPADADNLLEKISYLVGRKCTSEPGDRVSILAELVSSASVAAALINEGGEYKAVSRTYAEAGSRKVEDLIGQAATDIFPDLSGETSKVIDEVRRSGQPHFISRYPYFSPHQPEKGVTYWDAAVWPIASGDAGTEILVVVRQKEQSGDILAAV